MTTTTIDLSCRAYDWVVLSYPTGIKYCGQVGGMSCDHPEVEGFIIPIFLTESDKISNIMCENGSCYGEKISIELANILEKYFPIEIENHIQIIIDKDRLSEGTECWIPIKTCISNESGIRGWEDKTTIDFLNNKIGFLCLSGNCD